MHFCSIVFVDSLDDKLKTTGDITGSTWAATADIVRNRSLRAINLVVACVLPVQFATQIQFHSFEIWPFNFAIKDIAQQLRQETRDRPAQSVSLSTNFTH
jgi:hypothetical protein